VIKLDRSRQGELIFREQCQWIRLYIVVIKNTLKVQTMQSPGE